MTVMIKEASLEDKKQVYELWKASYPSQNQNYLTYYFKTLFDQGTCLLQEQDNKVISSIQMNEQVISFGARKIAIAYLLGVSTLPDYRRRGHMRTLMEAALDETSHNYLFTFIKAFNPKLYAPYGFETVYAHRHFLIKSEELNKVSCLHTQKEATASQLLYAYKRFIVKFDGYYIRDLAYYERLLEELELKEKRMVVYRDPVQGVCGYLIYQIIKDEIQVKEAIYQDSISLMRMLKAISEPEREILIEVSEKEHLEKIFPLAIPKKQGFMMVRVNNYELFNKYFNKQVKNAREAFEILKKPLWLHEYY